MYSVDVLVADLRFRFPEGTSVRLFGINGLPEQCMGEVDFVDDAGNIFIKTNDDCRNIVLKPTDENICFVKAIDRPKAVDELVANAVARSSNVETNNTYNKEPEHEKA